MQSLASAVKEFFLKACPDADNPARMFKVMREESLKWPPDKIAALFKGARIGDAEKMVVDTIAVVVIELRAEAQGKRGC